MSPLFVLLTGCLGKDASRDSASADSASADSADTSDSALPVDSDGDGWPEDADCDDANAAAHPDATEVCNGADDDCDGLVDDLDDSLDPTTASTWYVDADGDTFGDRASLVSACEAPEGTSSDDTDCDDGAADTWPGAPEVCADGIDQSCDGQADEGCAISGDHAVSEFGGRILGDTGGGLWSMAAIGDATGDGQADVLVGTPYWTEGALEQPGAAWLVPGPISGDEALSSFSPIVVGEETRSRVGSGVAGAGDLDADGFADLLIGSEDGGTALMYGPPAGSVGMTSADAWVGPPADESWGALCAGLGDTDGDGDGEFVIGGGSGTGYLAGGAWVFSGSVSGGLSVADADATFVGGPGSDVGSAVAGLGDLNGDGLADLGLQDHSGATWIYYGPLPGTSEPEQDADAWVQASWSNPATVLAGEAADADGDGRTDLLVWGNTSASLDHYAAWVLTSIPESIGTVDVADAEMIIDAGAVGDATYLQAGSWAGDMDGDGLADVALGVPQATEGGLSEAGAVSLFYALTPGTRSFTDADARVYGTSDGALTGQWLTAGVDLDGDGPADLLVGSPGETLGGAVEGIGSVVAGGL